MLQVLPVTLRRLQHELYEKMMDLTEEVNKWQLEHIRKGVEAARGGEFATDAEVEEFFRRYGSASSNEAGY